MFSVAKVPLLFISFKMPLLGPDDIPALGHAAGPTISVNMGCITKNSRPYGQSGWVNSHSLTCLAQVRQTEPQFLHLQKGGCKWYPPESVCVSLWKQCLGRELGASGFFGRQCPEAEGGSKEGRPCASVLLGLPTSFLQTLDLLA